jgi:hypothetical protein
MNVTNFLLLGFLIAASGDEPDCPAGAPLAFIGADVLTMDSAELLRGTTVLVRDRRILFLGADAVPPAACRIDARGKVLLPGLSDLHVHTEARELALFLANGVTLIRELNGSAEHLVLRDRIARGDVLGPHLLVASPLLVGTTLQYRHRLVSSADEARAAAHEFKDAGYDYLKIYDGLSRASYDALAQAADSLRIPLDGHIPAAVGLARVLQAGQSLQHMDKIAFALGGHRGDTTGLADARRLFAGLRAWVTPTLASLRVMDAARTSEYGDMLQQPEMAYVDSSSLAWWRSLAGPRAPRPRSAFYRFQLALLPVLREAGARFLLGTDAANPMMVAGFSVHDELTTLVRDGGFSPYEALRAATRNAGAFIGDTLRGRIVPGAPADMILADGNPLEDLAVLRRPAGVVVNGRWLDRAALDALLVSARLR